MALTFTLAGLQAELNAVAAAVKAANWELARQELSDYTFTYLGLVSKVGTDGVSAELPKPEKLSELLEQQRALASAIGARGKRIGVGRLNFGPRATL